MNFTEQIRNFTSQQASKMIVELLDRVTDKRLVQLTHLAEKLTSDDEVLSSIKAIRGFLESSNHSTKDLFRKVIRFNHPFPFEDHDPLDHVFQFSYISRPIVILE